MSLNIRPDYYKDEVQSWSVYRANGHYLGSIFPRANGDKPGVFVAYIGKDLCNQIWGVTRSELAQRLDWEASKKDHTVASYLL